MGGGCSRTVLSQVNDNAVGSSEPVKPHASKFVGSGDGAPSIEAVGKPPHSEIEFDTGTTPPGSIDMPVKATAIKAGSAVNTESKADHVVVGSLISPMAECNGVAAHGQSTYSIPAGSLLEANRTGHSQLQTSTQVLASVPDHLLAEDSGEVLHLVPVDGSESDAASLFHEYIVRVDELPRKTFDCTWEKLSGDIAKTGSGSNALEWYWLAATSSDGNPPCSLDPATADGLVVWRIVRTSTVYAQVCHLSLAGKAWCPRLPALLRSLRREMFQSLPVNTIRVTLWHAMHEDDRFKLDSKVEAPFRELSWRWFQLTNSSDTKRRQIMQLRRMEDSGDPPAVEDGNDIRICSCLFLPYIESDGTACVLRAEDGDQSSTRVARTASNCIVMAECLRRHALTMPIKSCHHGTIEWNPGRKGAEVQRSEEICKGDVAEGAEATVASIPKLLRRLERRGSIRMVQTQVTSRFEDCASWAMKCLAVGQAARSQTVLPATETQWPMPLTPEPDGEGGAAHVLCGNLAICTNWKDQMVDPADPSWVRVPIDALGHASASNLGSHVAYLATEDDDIFVIVWSLPRDAPEMSRDELYHYCQKVLQDAPPSRNLREICASETQDSSEPREVMLPRFDFRALAAASIPGSLEKAGGFGHPQEMLAARLSAQLPPRGALRRQYQNQNSQPVIKMDGPFVLCVWHAELDDLELPIFAVVVSPNDWSA